MAEVTAIDISETALEVAQKNSGRLGESVVFKIMDFTNESLWIDLPAVDILVSNPPYISEEERPLIPSNVIDHEPALALFVPSNDPLQFYRSIGLFGRDKLNPGGRIYVEIHESRGRETANLFESLGYSVVIRTDMQGKERMIRAERED
jgi:release factor glutamine methyltransferase